jgi:hypothetical protein
MPTVKPIDNSSQISRIAHCPVTNRLQVTFKNKSGGSTYEYPNFTADQFAEFLAADSKGSHFIKQIKPKTDVHPHRKLDPEKDEVWA